MRTYSAAVAARLPEGPSNITSIDGYGFFGHVVANSAGWGFDDVTSSAYNGAGIDAMLRGPADQVGADVSRYLFSDAIHVSATGHRLFAAFALAHLEAFL